jgi:hypothetical protein
VSDVKAPGKASKQMLGVLNLLALQGKYRLFEGTANRNALARRRAKNKVARRSRRINRHG